MPISRPETEVLIIGGGPAGCAAAITARKANLNVVLLEARATPAHVPGETLHPGIEPIFSQLGLTPDIRSARFHRHAGIWVQWGTPSKFQAYSNEKSRPWLGFQADRAKFGNVLLSAAATAGVTIFPSSRAIRIIRNEQRVIGVQTRNRTIYANWIIDAGGGRHWLANQLGLKIEYYSPSLEARFGWHKTSASTLPDPSISACPDGWDWQAKIDSNRTAWCKMRISRKRKNDRLHKRVFDATDVTWRMVSPCAGPGYFILGDAAAILDPASSHGILRAMMSGIRAAAIITHIHRGLAESDGIRLYDDWLTNWFNSDVYGLRALYKTHPDLQNWIPR